MENVSGVLGAIFGFIFGVLVPLLFLRYLPNEKFFKWGQGIGRKISAGGRKFLAIEAWEKLENNLLGSATAFVQGVEAGASEDDPEGDSDGNLSKSKRSPS